MTSTVNPETGNIDLLGINTIGDPLTSGTPGSILFVGTGPTITQDNANLFWDSTNQRFYINYSTHDLLSALTVSPKVATDVGIIIKGFTSQSANLSQWQDSTGAALSNIDNTGAMNYTNTSSWTCYTTGNSYTTSVGGRGSMNVTPILGWTSGPTGVLPKSSAQFGISDNRTLTTVTSNQDNIFGMEFNPIRGSGFSTVGVSSVLGGTMNFYAISGSVQDSAGAGSGGTLGYMPKNNPTANRDLTVNSGVFKLTYAQSYSVNTDAVFVYDMAGVNIAVSGTPTFTGAGTFRQNNYGNKIVLTGNTVGNSVGIGDYLAISGYDTNYGVVNAGSGNNYMGFNNSKALFGGTAFVLATRTVAHSITGNYGSIYYDGTDLYINPREVGSTATLIVSAPMTATSGRFDGGVGVGVAPVSTTGYGLTTSIPTFGSGYGFNSSITAVGDNASYTGFFNDITTGGDSAFINGIYTSIVTTGTTKNQLVYGNVMYMLYNDPSVTAYGDWIQSNGSITANDPSNDQIGLYVNWNTLGTDTNMKRWAIYNASVSTTAGKVFLGLDSTKTYWGTGFDASVKYDGTNLVVNPKEVGTGVLSVLGDISLIDQNMILGTTTGTKFGTGANQKIGFWNATPIVQPTTAIAAATFVTNTSLIANDTATFDGYTIGQVVKALRNAGLLA